MTLPVGFYQPKNKEKALVLKNLLSIPTIIGGAVRKKTQILVDLGCGEVVNINDPAVVEELTVQYFREMALEEYLERQEHEPFYFLDSEIKDGRRTKRIFQGQIGRRPRRVRRRWWIEVF